METNFPDFGSFCPPGCFPHNCYVFGTLLVWPAGATTTFFNSCQIIAFPFSYLGPFFCLLYLAGPGVLLRICLIVLFQVSLHHSFPPTFLFTICFSFPLFSCLCSLPDQSTLPFQHKLARCFLAAVTDYPSVSFFGQCHCFIFFRPESARSTFTKTLF